jgi:hypothetical protein
MSIPLPAIIGQVEQVGQQLLTVPQQTAALSNPDPTDSKPFIICTTRDIPDEVITVLQSYGTVKSYDHDIHANISPQTLQFQYLILDFRTESDRLYFQQYIMPQGLAYHCVLYHFDWENDMGVQFESEFSTFPKVQANRAKWDALLLSPPIKAPSCLWSFLTRLLSLGAK